MIFLKLFVTFVKIGLFSFGGGYGMIPLMQREVIQNHAWLTESEFLEYLAIAASAPGPIAVNMSTFVGYRQAGVAGSAVATLGAVLPSIVVILLIIAFYVQFRSSRLAEAVFKGLRPATIGLIASAVYILARKEHMGDYRFILISTAVFLAVSLLNWHPIPMLAAAGLAGALLFR